MSRSIRRRPVLRAVLATASALAISAGVAVSISPTAGAATSPTCEYANIDKLARATGGQVFPSEIDGVCYVTHSWFGFTPAATTDTFTVTDPNLTTIHYLVSAGGGGGGGGSGWEDSSKVSGTQPQSGAGAGGAGGEVKEGEVGITAGDYAIVVGAGGLGGLPGTSTDGNTVGGQGGSGQDSSIGELVVAAGGAGGFGGTGTEDVGPASFSPVVQAGVSPIPTDAGEYGGNNASFVGGTRAAAPNNYAGPGGAGAGENGDSPTSSNGAAGGDGVQAVMWPAGNIYGGGGGGGTLDPGSFPYASRTGGAGGAGNETGVGGTTGSGGGGKNARGGGGGGGNTDGSVTAGDSNAGFGGSGGSGAVYIRYVAKSAPVAPAAPTVVAGDSQVTVTITPLAETPDYYTVYVIEDPSKSCTITPPETSCVITGLTNGTDYTFATVAGNASGESASSEPSDIGTPEAPTTTTTTAASSTTTTPSGPLPYTGSDSRGMAAMAMVLVAIGGAVTIVARRRRSTIG